MNKNEDIWDSNAQREMYFTRYAFPYSENRNFAKVDFKNLVQSHVIHTRIFDLFLSLEAVNREHVFKENNSDLLELIKGNGNITEAKRSALIELFENLVALIKNDQKRYYPKLKDQLIQYPSKFSNMICQITLLNLINYAIRKSKVGDFEFSAELKELFEFGLEKQILLVDNKISFERFNNIVDTMSKLGDLKWTENFIETWGKCLDTNHRQATINLAWAIVNFSNKKFEEVLGLLSRTDLPTIDHKLRARWMSLCCHFELYQKSGNDDMLKYCIKASNEFLNRNETKINDVTLNATKNLIMIIRQLYKKSSKSEWNIDSLENKNSVFGFWVKEKIKEFE